MKQIGPHISSHGLDRHGLHNLSSAHWNGTTAELYEAAICRHEGHLAADGPLVVRTGHHTGRSANDKFIVREPGSEKDISWGAINREISERHFSGLRHRMLAYLQGRDVFVQDLYAGADPTFRIPIRVITETAWHSLFTRNMLITPPAADLAHVQPEFTIIHAPRFHAVPEIDGTQSEVFIIINFAERLVLIGGTSYAGEIKKSVFSILNFLLPARDVLPMHCSANVGTKGDAAVFFGLSGTGKTTLSADPERTLVGDDEHGWGADGLFNFEGGCYAKVIALSAEAEPEIYATTRRFGTVLENVTFDADTRVLNLDDASLTENTRAAYPISFIPNASATGRADHPKNVIMLTADAFGVLPPIARLSPDQAMYHFLSGYTAKVAGTEKGLGNEPQATFSTCFGAPFMPRHPSVYAKMLGEKIARQDVACWLVNTGWSGGSYGVGRRMKIQYTRALLRAALDGSLGKEATLRDQSFGLQVPAACPNVPADVMRPRDTWADKSAYDQTVRTLIGRFHANFKQFEPYVTASVKQAAPPIAA
ncbi:MAG: phosphoenolpyruvate carboxykinase [Alphaproteobacteria bacterium]|nr:phosphoenolpyruvate carboxykinase [Alphaproteobacteria bacterium]